MTEASSSTQRSQLAEQRRKVDFDTYDVTVDELLRRVQLDRMNIAPVYQRQFRWGADRQSKLIESVLLGIPVPPLFMATNHLENVQAQWEVVDGLQRLLTLVNFAGVAEVRKKVGLTEAPLRLVALDKLKAFEGFRFDGLPRDVQGAFLDRPFKVVVLNDKSDQQVRYDLFERLNTGGISLTPQEIRECVFRGEFVDLLGALSQTPEFKKVIILPESRWKDGTPEDYVLRFFAFCDKYQQFNHSVQEFLTDYITDAVNHPDVDVRTNQFEKTFKFLSHCFPKGIRTRKGQTPVNLYEGIAVGAHLALLERPDLKPTVDPGWLGSNELKKLVTGATNSKPRVSGRIHYCRDRFLNG